MNLEPSSERIIRKGIATAAGQVTGVNRYAATLSFPADRSAAYSNNILSAPLYPNGLYFTAVNVSDQKVSSLASYRRGQQLQGTFRQRDGLLLGRSSEQTVASILMPMSDVDTDTLAHNLNTTTQSRLDKGNGDFANIISNLLSDAVAGVSEKITGGALADSGEAIYNAARNSYGGAQLRSKTFSWTLTPKNVKDLKAVIDIIETFQYQSLGMVKESSDTVKKQLQSIADTIGQAANVGKDLAEDKLSLKKTEKYQPIIADAVNFLSNSQVIKSPPLWFIRSYSIADGEFNIGRGIFGPALIESISVNRAKDGKFLGLAEAPNHSQTVVLDITFREVIAMNRSIF